MARDRIWWGGTAAAVLALVLALANLGLRFTNASAQDHLMQRQDYINQTPQLAQVDQLVVRVLAEAAQRNGDDKIKSLLASNGITITATPPPAPTPTTAPGPAPAPAARTP